MAVTVVAIEDDNMSTQVKSPLLNGGSVTVEGSVDFKGRPAVRSESGCWKSAFYILGVEAAERFTFYGVRSNLVNYLTGPMGESTAMAAMNVNVLIGTADLSPLLGAFVADAVLGPYWTIVLTSIFYVLGLGCLSISVALYASKYSNCTNAMDNMTCSPPTFHIVLFFFSLYLVALMQGGHRPCLQAFGADQFDAGDKQERKAKASFFNWWNFSMSAGVLIAYTVLNYIQENISWELGFAIPFFTMLYALVVFPLGTGIYRFRVSSHKRNPFEKIGSICRKVASPISKEALQNVLRESTQSKVLDQEAIVSSNDSQDHAKTCTIFYTEDVKAILKLVPFWSTCLGFAIITAQSSTLFIKQGATMERYIGSNFEIPSASLQSLIKICMIVIIPIYDLIFVPIARSINKNLITGITVLQRIGVGQLLSIITMIVAALVEKKRIATISMSIWWLVPQYLFLGTAQCFACVGLQELFYHQVPSKLKSLGIALNLSIFGIGNFLSSFLISIIEKATTGGGKESWFSDNLNQAHLDYFYWVLAAINTISFVAYLYFAKHYVYVRKVET